MKPLVHDCPAERGQPRPVPRGDEAVCGIEPQTASSGPAWGGPALGPGRGFTLIEMLVVLAMLGVLASAARPLLEMSVQRSREHELRQGLRTLREALDAYKRAGEAGAIAQSPEDSGYPKTLQLLVDGVPDVRSPSGRKLYFLRRLPPCFC